MANSLLPHNFCHLKSLSFFISTHKTHILPPCVVPAAHHVVVLHTYVLLYGALYLPLLLLRMYCREGKGKGTPMSTLRKRPSTKTTLHSHSLTQSVTE